jgi:hypothetical protein
MISLSSSIQASTAALGSELAGELVLLDPRSGIYYGLNQVGARVWNLIQEPTTVARVRDALMDEFDVDPLRCETDVIGIVEQLATHRLATVTG